MTNIFSIRLIRGSTYTRVYTVVMKFQSYRTLGTKMPCGLNAEEYKKLKDSTGLSDEELESRYQVFSFASLILSTFYLTFISL